MVSKKDKASQIQAVMLKRVPRVKRERKKIKPAEVAAMLRRDAGEIIILYVFFFLTSGLIGRFVDSPNPWSDEAAWEHFLIWPAVFYMAIVAFRWVCKQGGIDINL